MPSLDEFHRHLTRLQSEAGIDSLLAGDLASAVGGTRVLRVTLEMIRFPGKASKLLASARLATFPAVDTAPFEAAGFALKRTDVALSLRRADDSLLFIQEEGFVGAEHSCERANITPEDAAASLAAIAPLAPFAGLARGNAVLQSWGLARDHQHGLLGLVAIHRDLERREEDERSLRDAGLGETSDEGLWSTRDGSCSLVWMGGTVYGYLGPVPENEVGGWL